jgi:hypothetical protein
MSLAPKIDEIAYTIKTADANIALFTETWLRDTVPDIPLISNITNFIEETVSTGFMEAYVCT